MGYDPTRDEFNGVPVETLHDRTPGPMGQKERQSTETKVPVSSEIDGYEASKHALSVQGSEAVIDEFLDAHVLAGRPDPWVLVEPEFRRLCAALPAPLRRGMTLQFNGARLLYEGLESERPEPAQPEPGKPFRLQDLTPVRDRLIVAPLAVSSRSKGGIHLVETGHQRERPQHGIVLATGAGVWNPAKTERVPVEAHRGDCVFYGKYSGQAFDLEGREILNMSEAEVFSILRQGTFVLVEHENPKLNHLQGDFCDECSSPEEKAARARLEEERREFVESQMSKADYEAVDLGAVPSQQPEADAKTALEAERERMRQKRGEAQG